MVALSLAFAAGSATTLATLGVGATLLGKVWGSLSGGGLVGGAVSSLLAAAFAVACGLNLLGFLEFDLPALPAFLSPGGGGGGGGGGTAPGKAGGGAEGTTTSLLQGSLRSFAFGASSALVSSPCSTPVLASLLGFVASSSSSSIEGQSALESYALGLGLLLVYTAGYTTPVVAAGALGAAATTDAAKKGGSLSESFTTPVLAAALIAYGTYSGLDAAFPPPPPPTLSTLAVAVATTEFLL